MKILIKEMNDGSAVIETLCGQKLSFFKNMSEAKIAYFEWYQNHLDVTEVDDEYYLM